MAVKFLPPSAHTGKGRETWLVRGTPSPVALLYGLQRTVDALAFQSSLAVCARAHYTVRSVCLESIRASCTAFWEGDLTISAASPLNTHKQPPIKQTSRLFAAYRQSRGKWPACCPSHLGTGDRHTPGLRRLCDRGFRFPPGALCLRGFAPISKSHWGHPRQVRCLPRACANWTTRG